MASIYDRRMEEIARQKAQERAGLDRIAESTETINRGLANPLVYILGIGSIVGVPFTGGFSIVALIVAILLLTGGGKACTQAIPPTTADMAAPRAGCIRILASVGLLALLLIVVLLFLALIAYDMGVKP